MRPLASRTLSMLVVGLAAACGSDTVAPAPECTVSAVTVGGGGVTREVGQTVQLTAQITAQDCATAPTPAWSAAPEGRVTISPAGLVTAVAPGVATITATAGGVSGTTQVTVVPAPPAAVRIAYDSVIIGEADVFTLSAAVVDAQDNVVAGQVVTWTLIDVGGVTLAPTGVVTGLTAGTSSRIEARSGTFADTVRVNIARPRLAFMWNDQLSEAGPYEPSTPWSFNISGTPNAVTRTAVGRYSGSWPGLVRANGEAEVVLASYYGTTQGAYCTIDQWTINRGDVACRTAAGADADARWTMAVVGSATLRGRSAFAWIPDGTSSTPASSVYRYNPSGREIRSTFVGTGHYTVRFEGLGRTGGADREAVLVTAYGSANTCQAASWATTAGHLDIDVRCFAPNGAAANSQFVVLVADGARTGAQSAFVVADQPTSADPYTPTNRAVRPGPGTAEVRRLGPGRWRVDMTGFFRAGGTKETFLIAPTGTTAARCSVSNWEFVADPASTLEISVWCGTPAGTAADVPFVLVGVQ